MPRDVPGFFTSSQAENNRKGWVTTMKITRRMTAITAILLCLALLASCRADKTDEAKTEAQNGPVIVAPQEPTAHTEVLTGVYRPVPLALTEGYEAGSETQNCSPYIDAETGAVTVLLTRIDRNADDGEPLYLIVTTDAEHGVTRTVPLPDFGEGSVARWAFDGEERLFFAAQRTRERSEADFRPYCDIDLYRYDLPDGEHPEGALSEALPLNPLFGANGEFYVQNFAADADGDLWVECIVGNSGRQIVFTPELVQKTVRDEYLNTPMTAIPDSAGGGVTVKLNSTVIGATLIGRDGSKRQIELPELPDRIVFPQDGDGGTFYYSTNSGVWRAVLDERENAAVECLMDFKNSNVKTNVNGGGGEWAYLLSVFSEDCFLFTENGSLALYTASGDIDLSSLKVVEVALGTKLGAAAMDWSDLFVEYNRDHPGCRVVLRDYTIYNNSENPDGGLNRLTMDILTGIYRPDLVIAEYGDALTQVIVRDRLYEDLSPFMEADDVVNRDNLFDCAERMFAAPDGGIWGMTGRVKLWGPLSARSVLDRYAPDLTEESGWTFERMLDAAENMPADTVFYHSLRQDNAESMLLGPDGYGVFVDLEKGEAHFDSPLFLRWLNFYASLPKDTDEWMKVSPTGQLYAKRDWASVYDWAYQDRILLQWAGINDLKVYWCESLFGTKDWVYLGHPAEGHSGIDCRAENCVVMTRWCAERETAWDVIHTLIADGDSLFQLPTLKTVFERNLEREDPYNRQTIVYFDGATIASERDPDMTQEKLTRPGYLVLPEAGDIEHIRRLLDTVGYPLAEKLPPEIASIVAEEISAWTGGVGTAENCAAKIQSRVSIWLAEHS